MLLLRDTLELHRRRLVPPPFIGAASAMHHGIYCSVSDDGMSTTCHDAFWDTISALNRVYEISLRIRTPLQNGEGNI